MGWRFRKSINLGGGFRINLSKSGIGYSWGVKGFRITQTASGQTRKTYSIPGTGISYVETKKNNYIQPQIQPKAEKVLTIGETTYYTSENLDEMSKNDIILKKIKETHTLDKIANILCLLVVFIPIGLLIKLFISAKGKIDLEYEFDSYSKEKYDSLNTIVTEMKQNKKLWRVNTSVKNADLKYSSGATNSISRVVINIKKGMPWYIKTNIDIYYIENGKKKIYLTPDRIIVLNGFKVVGCKYNNLDFNIFNSRFVEEEIVPKDATIISYTWKYVNKNGGPDRRFNDNRQLPICDYGGMSVTSTDGINFRIQCSNIKIMASVSEQLNKFVEIVNKELESENVYYNFECITEDEKVTNEVNFLEETEENEKETVEKDNVKINESVEDKKTLEDDEQMTNKKINSADIIELLKRVLKFSWLTFKVFLAALFILCSLLNEMYIASLLWLIFGILSIYSHKNRKTLFKIINALLFVFAFFVFVFSAPKEYDGLYKSDSNIQVILENNIAYIINEDGTKLEGKVVYKINNDVKEIIIKINDDKEYYYLYDSENEVLFGNDKTYYKRENVE